MSRQWGRGMNRSEKVELGVILALSLGCWLTPSPLPNRVDLGYLLLSFSVLFLVQGLVRDVWLLSRSKRAPLTGRQERAGCVCAESSVGAAGGLSGATLVCAGISRPIMMEKWMWGLCAFGVMGTGFLIKDYILEWNPWRIRRDKDHINIVFTFRGEAVAVDHFRHNMIFESWPPSGGGQIENAGQSEECALLRPAGAEKRDRAGARPARISGLSTGRLEGKWM